MADPLEDPAVGLFFRVTIDDHDLGVFTGCDGLGCEVQVESREEGGNQFFVHQLPGRVKFNNITLTRPVNGQTAAVAQWISGMATKPQRSTGQIAVFDLARRQVAQWGLVDVIPVRWKGPSLKSEGGASAATETLELAHHGFFEPGRGE